jgi:hypothetical protein
MNGRTTGAPDPAGHAPHGIAAAQSENEEMAMPQHEDGERQSEPTTPGEPDSSTGDTADIADTADTEVIAPEQGSGSTARTEAPKEAPTETVGSAAETDRRGAPPTGYAATTYGATSWNPTVTERPRVRTGAIVWGALVVAFAVAAIAVSASPEVRHAFDAWQASLTPVTWMVIGVVALGIVVLLIAGVSAIRGAQRRASSVR